MAVSLSLKPAGPPSLLGEAGSRPLGASTNAAFQHANSRMGAQGTLVLDGATYSVKGLVWFTHLWGPFDGTGKAFDGLTTWTAHLDDGRDLRIETFRAQKKGQGLPTSVLWFEDGVVREEALDGPPEVTGRWRSIRGISYPVAWRVALPEGELSCRSHLPDGEVLYELRLYFVNWTSLSWVGSCSLQGTIKGRPVRGDALIESTGYEPPRSKP
jgi:predicted secreted hydrolase